MHLAIELLIYWGIAFISLSLAVVLMSLFNSVIDSDLELHSLGKEAVLAGIASLIEAASLCVILQVVEPSLRAMGLRAMIVPIIIVALIYKIAHLENWSGYDAVFLLAFQIFICCLFGALLSAHFGTAMVITLTFVICLAIIASFAKGL